MKLTRPILKVEDIREDQILFTVCGKPIILDKDDAKKYQHFRIYNTNNCATISIKGKTVYLHRLISKPKPNEYVDHINHNRFDNRKANLRNVLPFQSAMNRRKPKGKRTSQYKGVYFNKQKQKWFARFQTQGKVYWLGLFDYEICAALAYQRKAKQICGEYLCLEKS